MTRRARSFHVEQADADRRFALVGGFERLALPHCPGWLGFDGTALCETCGETQPKAAGAPLAVVASDTCKGCGKLMEQGVKAVRRKIGRNRRT